MERLTRLIGIGLLVGAFATSVGYYQRASSGMTSDQPDREMTLPIESAADGESAAEIRSAGSTGSASDRSAGSVGKDDPYSPPPRYLTFTEGIRSGLYQVADVPTSRDRDVTPSRHGIDDSYPIETDLVPHSSLAKQGQLAPGLYATEFGVRDCRYEIHRVDKSRTETMIGEDRLSEGRMLVTINEIEPDTFNAMPQCGDWVRWSPLVEPLTRAGNGDYWVGDLAAGTWTVPTDCVWEKVVGFRGAELVDVQDSAVGPAPLVVDDDTLGVRIRGCDAALQLQDDR
ncbi:MAG: hypothetical protein ACR2QK_22580 [Acidimicrobiales bacterium]